GQNYIVTFTFLALAAIIILYKVGQWFKIHGIQKNNSVDLGMENIRSLPKRQVYMALTILMVLMFSKFFYMAALKNYLTFYMIDRFDVSVQSSQVHLFLFLFAVAAGTIAGGPLGDKYGRKSVIWFSILGAAPFALVVPYVNLVW